MLGLGRHSALVALAHAVTVADLDAWRSQLGSGPGPWLASRRISKALKAAARRLGVNLEVGRTTHLDVSSEADPVGAKVALLQAAWLIAAGRGSMVAETSLAAVLQTEAGSSAAIARRADLTSTYWKVVREVSKNPPRRTLFIAVAVVAVVALLAGAAVSALTTSALDEPAVALANSPINHLETTDEAPWIEAITDWVVAVDQLGRLRSEGALSAPIREAEEAVAAHRQAIVGPELTALSTGAKKAFVDVLDTGLAATDGTEGWEERENAFAEAVRTLNRVLARDGLGYFFDAYAAFYPDGRGEVGLFSFKVVARIRYRQSGGGGPALVDALHLRRIDRLNLVQFLLGYTSKRMDVAVILLDKLEQQLATRLLPALRPNADMPLSVDGAAKDEDSAWWAAVKKRAGQHAREAFNGAFPGELQALTELGELLYKRVALFEEWNTRLAHRNITLREPENLEVPTTYRDQFERATSQLARATLDDLQERLEVVSNRKFFARLIARHAASVERHEVQHRLDYGEAEFKVPPALYTLLGVDPEDERVKRDKSIERTAYELSAYTAELARDPAWLHVNLALLAEHLYDGSGGPEGYSALLILDGLGAELGVFGSAPDSPRPLAEKLPVAPERVAALHLALMDKPAHLLAKAAEALWQRWFDKPLASLAREDEPPE